ncbi:hypothetical protein Fot_27849 [Forsythia ovata]|uniref:Uncharacterized protein n=1 Tax=Forsythia ovata TaxID=205694 RepID=A0ABD1TMP3_9LAMI
MGCCHRRIAIVLHRATPIILDLFSNSHRPPSPIELQEPSHLPLGWQKSLDIKGKPATSRVSGPIIDGVTYISTEFLRLPHAAWMVDSLKPEVGATPTEPIDKVLLLPDIRLIKGSTPFFVPSSQDVEVNSVSEA